MESISAAKDKLLARGWDFASYPLWASFYGVRYPHEFIWKALKTSDPARADHQTRWTHHQTLIPDRDLSPTQHVLAPSGFNHPFEGWVRLEKDLQYAISMSVHFGLQIGAFRDCMFDQLRSPARIVAPLDVHLLAARYEACPGCLLDCSA